MLTVAVLVQEFASENLKPRTTFHVLTGVHCACVNVQMERLAVDCDGRGIYDVAPTISTLSSLLRQWLAEHDRTTWGTKHSLDARKTEQPAVGMRVSVGSSATRQAVLQARL